MVDIQKQKKDGNEFVGRKRELNKLQSYMAKALESKGQLVLINGEAGVGKTVFAEEFADMCREQGFKVLRGRCLYFESTDPYIPFFEALKDHISPEEKDTDNNVGIGVTGYGVSQTRSGGVPMGLLGVAAEEEEHETIDISFSDRREIMFDKVTDLIQSLAEKDPVLFFIDDLQWIDGASAQLLHHLTRHIRYNRVLILGAYRPEELKVDEDFPLESVLDRMKEEKLFEEIELKRLPFKDSSLMIKKILKSEALPQSFLLMLYRETEGNPYYITEILNSMVEEGIIDPYSYDWNPEETLTDVIVPPSIKDITSRRIERLSQKEKKVLMYASVIGTEFDFQVLENSMRLDVIELLDIIDELENRGLIHEKESVEEEVFRFNHVQIRLTMYSSLGKSRKRVLHNQIGKAIEEVYQDNIEEYVFALGRHFYEGKNYDRAYDYSLKAAEKALGSFAIENAIEHFQKARDSLKYIEVEDKEQKEIELLEQIGHLAYDVSDWDAARNAFNTLLELSKKRDNRELEAESLRMLANILRDIQKYSESESYYQQSLKISEDIGYAEGIADSHKGLGYIHWREGMFKEAVEHYGTAVKVAQESDVKSILSLTYIDLGNTYAHRGENDQAIEYYLKAIPSLKEQNSWRELARAYNNLGDQYMKKEEWDKVIETFDKTIEYAKKIGNKTFVGWGYFNKAEALARMGNTNEAEIYAKRAESIVRKLSDLLGISSAYRVRGIIGRIEENYDDALKHMWKAMDVIADMDIPFTKAETKYNIGLIYLDKGDIEKAKMYFEDAKSTFERIGAEQYLKKVDSRLSQLS